MKNLYNKLLSTLDLSLAGILVIGSIFTVLYSIIVFKPIYTLIGVFALIPSLIWLRTKNIDLLDSINYQQNPRYFKIGLCAYSVFFIFSILSLYFRPETYSRPILFFFLLTCLILIVFIQIYISNGRVIILEIILISLLTSYSQQLLFPSLIGIDPWFHNALSAIITNTGYIPAGNVYSATPLFHLISSISSIILNESYKHSIIFVTTSIQIILLVLGIMILTAFYFSNEKIGLYSGLFMVIANHNIFMNYWVIPNGLGLVFVPLILLVFLKYRRSTIHFLVIIILSGSIILCHTIASLFMAIVLFIIVITYFALSKKANRRLNIKWAYLPLIFTGMMLSWWIYISGSFNKFMQILNAGFSMEYFYSSSITVMNSYNRYISLSEQFVNNFGMFLFFSLSLTGVFLLLRENSTVNQKQIAVIALFPLALSFITLISGLSIIEHRWWYFAQYFLSIPISVAMVFWMRKKSTIKLLSMSIIVVALGFFLVISPTANTDNNYLSPNSSVRFALIDSEIAALQFASEKYASGISIDSDFGGRISSSPLVIQYAVPERSVTSLDDSLYSRNFDHNGFIKIIRQEMLINPIRIDGATYRVPYDPNAILRATHNIVYTNDMVREYV